MKLGAAVPAAAAPNTMKPVKAVKPSADTGKSNYNRLANLGAFAHPAKKKKK